MDTAVLFAGLDRRDTKNTIRDTILDNLARMGVAISKAKADKVANAYKRGRLDELDPETMRLLGYADPTGETAVNRVLTAA